MGSEETKLERTLKGFSPSSTMVDYIKRFFYQIIGIYFPAAILFLYIFLFWFVGPSHFDTITFYKDQNNFKEGWPKHIGNNTVQIMEQESPNSSIRIIPLILFLIAIVILGEGINALTARLTKLTPLATSISDSMKFSVLESSFGGVYRNAGWPIWLNETSFPVSFAQFDRYYVSALEQDKRTLAGKIGWVSFYRNMVAVFLFIFILQVILTIVTSMHGYETYILVISAIAIVLLLFGYRAQIRSNYATFWDAYKRYQLRKNLEIRYGDLALSLGIKDKYKTKALEYMVDRWFLAVDNTIQTVSRHFLTRVEKEYARLYRLSQSSKANKSLAKAENELRKKLTTSYSDWNRGAYERVIAETFKAFEIISKVRNYKDIDKNTAASKLGDQIPTAEDWKIIVGFYTLENSLRTDAAFLEIVANLSNWGWTIKNDKDLLKSKNSTDNSLHSPNSLTLEAKPSSGKSKIPNYYSPLPGENKDNYDDLANLIRETSDEYQKALFQVMHTLKTLLTLLSQNKLDNEQKEELFRKVRILYHLFGRYQYEDAFKCAKSFFHGTFVNGSVDLTLKYNGIFSAPRFSQYVTKQSDVWKSMLEGATVTEIINPNHYKLSNFFQVGADGKRSNIGILAPYSSLKINENEKKMNIIGEWSVSSIDPIDLMIPQELDIKIKWKIALEAVQMFIEDMLLSKQLGDMSIEVHDDKTFTDICNENK